MFWWWLRNENKLIKDAQKEDAQNLESWKVEYVREHAHLVGRVTALETPLQRLETDVRSLIPQIAVIINRLDTIERLTRETRGKVDGT